MEGSKRSCVYEAPRILCAAVPRGGLPTTGNLSPASRTDGAACFLGYNQRRLRCRRRPHAVVVVESTFQKLLHLAPATSAHVLAASHSPLRSAPLASRG